MPTKELDNSTGDSDARKINRIKRINKGTVKLHQSPDGLEPIKEDKNENMGSNEYPNTNATKNIENKLE